jgi:hypothetical protein
MTIPIRQTLFFVQDRKHLCNIDPHRSPRDCQFRLRHAAKAFRRVPAHFACNRFKAPDILGSHRKIFVQTLSQPGPCIVRTQHLNTQQGSLPNNVGKPLATSQHQNIRDTYVVPSRLQPALRCRENSPFPFVISKDAVEHVLNSAMLPLAHIAPLDLPVHKITVGAKHSAQVLFLGHRRRNQIIGRHHLSHCRQCRHELSMLLSNSTRHSYTLSIPCFQRR